MEGVLESGAVVVAGDGALFGVAPWAGGAGREGGPVLEEVELEGRFR